MERQEMSDGLSLSDLIEYTEWERGKWQDWFAQNGDGALAISAGPHGDGRFQSVGDLVLHIFSAEKRYIDQLSNRPITDTSSIASDSAVAIFDFGRQSRADLKEFVGTVPAQEWEAPQEFAILNNALTATPRKIVVHVLMHEIRHWAQIGTLLRLNGYKVELHDLLFSPVLGGEVRQAAG
jgi:uncharacterized damage-inducible protein DinB